MARNEGVGMIKHHLVSIIIEYMKVKLFLLKGKVIP